MRTAIAPSTTLARVIISTIVVLNLARVALAGEVRLAVVGNSDALEGGLAEDHSVTRFLFGDRSSNDPPDEPEHERIDGPGDPE